MEGDSLSAIYGHVIIDSTPISNQISVRAILQLTPIHPVFTLWTGAKSIGLLLSQGSSLAELNLSSNTLCDEGGVAIAEALQYNSGLASLAPVHIW